MKYYLSLLWRIPRPSRSRHLKRNPRQVASVSDDRLLVPTVHVRLPYRATQVRDVDLALVPVDGQPDGLVEALGQHEVGCRMPWFGRWLEVCRDVRAVEGVA